MSRYKRKSDNGPTHLNGLLEAIKQIKINKKSISTIARAFNIPKSSLSRYVAKVDARIADISTVNDDKLLTVLKQVTSFSAAQQVFSSEMEEALVDYIKNCRDKLNITDLRTMVYRFARDMRVDYPSNWDRDQMAGRHWYYSFARRHSHLNLNGLLTTQYIPIKQEIDTKESIMFEEPSPTLKLSSKISTRKPFQDTTSNKPDFHRILQAIKEIKMSNKTLSDTSRTFNISEVNLLHYITEFDAEISEISFLNDEDLFKVVKRIASSTMEPQHCFTEDIDGKGKTTFTDPSSSPVYKTDVLNFSNLLQAIKEVKIHKNSLRATAQKYNVPKTSLSRYITRFDAAISDILLFNDDKLLRVIERITAFPKIPQIFTTKEEEALVDFIKNWCDQNNRLSEIDLRKLIYQFARELQVNYPASWDKHKMSKKNWCHALMERHECLSLSRPMLIDLNKMEMKIDNPNVTTFAESPISISPVSSLSSTFSAIEPLPAKPTSLPNFKTLLQAIKEVKVYKRSIRATSGLFNIPKTSFSRYMSKFDAEITDISSYNDDELLKVVKRIATFPKVLQIFSDKDDEVLVDYVKNCLDCKGKINITKFRRRAYQLARDRQLDYPQNWDKDEMAAKHWYNSFAQRHLYLNLNNSEKTYLSKVKDETDCKEMIKPSAMLSHRPSLNSTISKNEFLSPTPVKKSRSILKNPKTKRKALTNLKKSKPPAKRARKQFISTALFENKNLCIICMRRLPRKLSSENSVIYSEYNRPVHLKCAEMKVIC